MNRNALRSEYQANTYMAQATGQQPLWTQPSRTQRPAVAPKAPLVVRVLKALIAS